jgi:hypothetical protein
VRALTVADRILIVAAVCLVVSSFLIISIRATGGSLIIVEVQGIPVHKALLTDSAEFRIQGTRGALTVAVRDGKVAIIQSECPNHACVRMGWRFRSGDVIVCVPNETIIRILNKRDAGIRATTG